MHVNFRYQPVFALKDTRVEYVSSSDRPAFSISHVFTKQWRKKRKHRFHMLPIWSVLYKSQNVNIPIPREHHGASLDILWCWMIFHNSCQKNQSVEKGKSVSLILLPFFTIANLACVRVHPTNILLIYKKREIHGNIPLTTCFVISISDMLAQGWFHDNRVASYLVCILVSFVLRKLKCVLEMKEKKR